MPWLDCSSQEALCISMQHASLETDCEQLAGIGTCDASHVIHLHEVLGMIHEQLLQLHGHGHIVAPGRWHIHVDKRCCINCWTAWRFPLSLRPGQDSRRQLLLKALKPSVGKEHLTRPAASYALYAFRRKPPSRSLVKATPGWTPGEASKS